MPYIVTTKRPDPSHIQPIEPVVSTRAAATLEEAQHTADAFLTATEVVLTNEQAEHFYRECYALPESGGTVGPLPDGTVIEVGRVAWLELLNAASLGHRRWLYAAAIGDESEAQWAWTEILDAFNAREKAKA